MAAAKGFAVSLLIGHATYYPRFRYQPYAFGTAHLVAPGEAFHTPLLEMRSPHTEDVSRLCALWEHEEGAVDMALVPGHYLLDWLSPHPGVQATVYTRSGEVVGYTRVHPDAPTRPRVFLATDAQTAQAMLATMTHTLSPEAVGMGFILALHPSSASAPALGQATTTSENWAMACSLGPSPLEDYLARVRSGLHPPGRPMWPSAFDLD